jgi:hypothetical protein
MPGLWMIPWFSDARAIGHSLQRAKARILRIDNLALQQQMPAQ